MRCVLVKDVDGLYASDPAIPGPHRLRFAETTYETALEIGTKLVQPKAVRHAASRGLRFVVGHQARITTSACNRGLRRREGMRGMKAWASYGLDSPI